MIILKLGTKIAGKTKETLWNHFYSQAQRDTCELKPNANDSQMPPSAALTSSLDSGWYPVPCLNSSLEYLLSLFSCRITSDFLWPHELWPARLLCPQDSPGENTGVGCYFLLQGNFPAQGSNPSLLGLLCWQADSLPPSHLGSQARGGSLQMNTSQQLIPVCSLLLPELPRLSKKHNHPHGCSSHSLWARVLFFFPSV